MKKPLAFGPTHLAIPGPSVMPERVLRAMHRASPNIYEGEMTDLTWTLMPDLKAVARTKGQVALYIANGHGAWEAALANTVAPGQTVLVLVTGRFGEGWGAMARTMGIETEILDFGMEAPVDPQAVEDALRADTQGRIGSVLTVQTDTASSVRNDIAAIREAIDAAGHDALLQVDCMASLGCDRFEMDAWGVDVMMAGCQKGLMTPAGMAFVFFNEKADAVRAGLPRVSQYWDWVPRTRPELYYQLFCGTAPTHHLYGLREALDMLVHEEGVEACWARHETIAHAVWQAVERWGRGGEIALNIASEPHRSRAVTAVALGDGDGTRLRRWTEHEGGVTLGIGLGFGAPGSCEYERRLRIGHMGHQSVASTMATLGTMQAGLAACDIPHGSGALDAAAAILANHHD